MANEVPTFLSFFRRHFPVDSHLAEGRSRLEGQLNLNVTGRASVTSAARTNTAMIDFQFFGPSDVRMIQPSAIARVEPPPGTHDFEPNYFPYIEFRDPDFLWRYSLDPTTNTLQQQPWLALLALKSGEGSAFKQSHEGLWTIEIDSRLLPTKSPFDSLTGHVQLMNFAESSTEHVQGFINSFPEKNCSRLFCFSKLEKETSYMLLLVPYYLSGATGNEESGLASIFELGQNQTLTLPVYYHSYFKTSEKGDFEFLARRLKMTSGLQNLGTSPVDITHSLGGILMREGALAAPGYASVRTTYLSQIEKNPQHTEALFDELVKNFSVPESSLEEEDPLITVPYYGKQYQSVQAREKSDWMASHTPHHWSEELNLDLRNRIAAALGTKVIQQKQNEYLKACWFQVGDLRLANEKLKRAQAGIEIARSYERRYLQPMSNERFVMLTRPFQSHFSYKERGASISLKKRLNDSGLPLGVTQPVFLRVARQKLSSQPFPILTPWKAKPDSPISPTRKDPRRPNRTFDLDQKMKIFLPIDRRGTVLPLKKYKVPVKPINLEVDFRPKFDSSKAMEIKLKSTIGFNDPLKGISSQFNPIMSAPEISEPMYQPLKALSLDYVLPGIKEVPNNSVTLLEENRLFIESYLCGLNDEMGKELIWNLFPTDQKGTIFSYFWQPTTMEPSTPPKPTRDTSPLDQWKTPRFSSSLGTNRPGIQESGQRVVLLLKGDLIRRYPKTIVFALTRTLLYNQPGEAHETTIPPAFRAQLGPDILVIGFPFTTGEINQRGIEYYFVLQEHQELLRFGLDEDQALVQTPDSAQLAKNTIQQPIQIVIHKSQLLETS